MLTALLSLSLRVVSILLAPCQPVEWPALQPPDLYEYGVPLPVRDCRPTTYAAVTMYALGIDAAVPVVGEELEADIYTGDVP